MPEWFHVRNNVPPIVNTKWGAWVSPVVLVKHADGERRAYLDRGRDNILRWLDDDTGEMLKGIAEWAHLNT